MSANLVLSRRVEMLLHFLVGACLVLALAGIVLSGVFRPEYLRFVQFDWERVLNLLLSLFVATLFVERASEVVVNLVREPYRKRLSGSAEEEAGFSADTGRFAAALGLLIGIIVSWVGLRALRPMIATNAYEESAALWQRHIFTFADVLVTGALLGGGSEGMHKIVMAVLELFTKWREVTKGPTEPKK